MLSQHLVQKQTQKLVITQDLRQSIELLPLSNLELSEKVQKELMENPFLEDASDSLSYEPQGDVPAPSASPESPAREEGYEDRWRENRGLTQENYTRSGRDKTEDKHQFLQNGLSRQENLNDHLLWQLRLSNLSSEEIEAGEWIISDIDERGFLKEGLEDLLEGGSIPLETARRALAQIHTMDPIGCGGRSIQETLLIQGEILHPDERIMQELLRNHFEDLERLDYKKIERSTGFTNEDIDHALQLIRTLEPYPGTLFAPRQPEYILPDLMVAEVDGVLEVIINDEWIPGLKVNEDYRSLLKGENRGSEADREYLQSRLNSALWLIKSIRQRRQTLYRVMKSILEFQEEFFRKGHGHLNPLTLREVAEKVELHESTISRITTNKYVQTRWGIFELKYFFSSSLRGKTGEQSHSARNIQDRIKQIVQEEDGEHPLSDQEIADIIHREGVEIARRTVAKYRKILQILPADRRKRLKKLGSS